MAERDADNRANASRRSPIDHKLKHDVAVTVPQGLEGAGVHAFLIHHASHRGRCHECRHQVEEVGKDVRERIDDLAHAAVGLITF